VAKLSTGSLARACADHPWRTILVWAILLVLALAVIATLLAGATTTDFAFSNDPESMRGLKLVDERFGSGIKVREVVILRSDRYTVDDPEFRSYLMYLTGSIMGLGDDVVEETVNYFIIPPEMGVPEEAFISADRHTSIIQVTMAGEQEQAFDNIGALHEATIDSGVREGFQLYITGSGTISEDFNHSAEQTLRQAEIFGIPIALLVLVFIFVALVAASIPLIIAAVAIAFAMAITAVTGQIWDSLSFFVINMITMMGLAVGIDYALFTVSRYREERAGGLDRRAAIIRSGSTASAAVFFSGLTVILALIGLLLVPMSLFQSLAAGAIFVVAMAILVTLTLLPAVLSLIGGRIDSPGRPALKKLLIAALGLTGVTAAGAGVAGYVTDAAAATLVLIAMAPVFLLLTAAASLLAGRLRRRAQRRNGGFWDHESRFIMKHPVLSLLAGVGVLVSLAVPSFDIETGQGKIEDLPHDLTGVAGTLVLKEDFPFAFTGKVRAVVDGPIDSPEVQAAMENYQRMLAGEPETFGPVAVQVNDARDTAIIDAPVPLDPASRQATEVVERVRSEFVPAAFAGSGSDVLITGEDGRDIAFNLDYYAITDQYRPIVISFVLGLSLILLIVVFRSLVVPVKAIIMNLLSVFASYGLLVLVFQKGYGNELFGFNQVETIDAWIPLFLFAILFGLSMDYHVFLLSRIRERYMETGDNTGSVAFGIRSTGSIITGAALIMVVIFGGFASGSLVSFQQMGFGMAVAVLLDATIIRSVVVPASMRLLGDWNWYLPRWLGWLPELHVEGSRADDA